MSMSVTSMMISGTTITNSDIWLDSTSVTTTCIRPTYWITQDDNIGYPLEPVYENDRCYYQPQKNRPVRIRLPDGTRLLVDDIGNWILDDTNTKKIRHGNNILPFNPYINVSDRMEEFMKFCANSGVHKENFMHLPIHLFIKWLVIEAAKVDKEEPTENLLPDLRKTIIPRCESCGKFLKQSAVAKKLVACSAECYDKLLTAA